MIQAKVIKDSVNSLGLRLTTFIWTYPRIILAEVNTHRMLSRNSPSSRAIPVEKMRRAIIEDPFIPETWPANKAGMQSDTNLDGTDCKIAWLQARDYALEKSAELAEFGLHKQIANRILEPWMWTTSIVSGTNWENFFHLRVSKLAQPEFQKLAYLALKAYLGSEPQQLHKGDWHIPFDDKMPADISQQQKLKIATARCARISYMTHDGQIDPEKDYAIHDSLAKNGHWSPFEHCAEACDYFRYANFAGWRQYRYTFPSQNRNGNLKKLLSDYENGTC